MKSYFLISAMTALMTAVPCLAQDPDLERRIIELGDDRVSVRESALEAIIAAGPSAIPQLRRALAHSDAEIRQRVTHALSELERQEKISAVCPPVTVAFDDVPFAKVLQEITRKTGVQFTGVLTGLAERRITKRFDRAPLMQVLDALAESASDYSWQFESRTSVCWRRLPLPLRPSAYSGGFKISLSRIDTYRAWDYLEGHGLMWIYMEACTEPGIQPVGAPRFEVSEIRDAAQHELSLDTEMQEGAQKGLLRDGMEKTGLVYESSPFTVNKLDRSVKALAQISGRVSFLFPLEKETVQMKGLGEESTLTRGYLKFHASEILTCSMRLTMTTSGDTAFLGLHLNPNSLVLLDEKGNEYLPGRDFDVCMDMMSQETLRYSIAFNEHGSFQPHTIRFQVIEKFFEKIVPFKFKNVTLP